MKRMPLIAILFFMISGCEKWNDDSAHQYIAEIVGFDLNCSTCILSFPYDSAHAKNYLGSSQNNYYQTVNLEKGNFKVGQKIRVNVRKAEDLEIKQCMACHLSYEYTNIIVSEYSFINDLKFNEPIYLGFRECISDYGMRNTICFDSVLTDSRCPEDVVCVWAGEAIVRFRFESFEKEPRIVDLHTGTIDTLINGVYFSFIDLLPYPNTEHPTSPQDYKARIIVKRR